MQSTDVEGRTGTRCVVLVDPITPIIRGWFSIIIPLYFNNHNHLGICYRGHPMLLWVTVWNAGQHLTLTFENFKTT